MSEPNSSGKPDIFVMPTAAFSIVPPRQFQIGELVRINLETGAVEFMEGYTPDSAAELFWSGVFSEYRRYLEWKRAQAIP